MALFYGLASTVRVSKWTGYIAVGNDDATSGTFVYPSTIVGQLSIGSHTGCIIEVGAAFHTDNYYSVRSSNWRITLQNYSGTTRVSTVELHALGGAAALGNGSSYNYVSGASMQATLDGTNLDIAFTVTMGGSCSTCYNTYALYDIQYMGNQLKVPSSGHWTPS